MPITCEVGVEKVGVDAVAAEEASTVAGSDSDDGVASTAVAGENLAVEAAPPGPARRDPRGPLAPPRRAFRGCPRTTQ